VFFTGEGEFGSVYKGSYLTDQGIVKEVAVKALSKEAVEPSQVPHDFVFTGVLNGFLRLRCLDCFFVVARATKQYGPLIRWGISSAPVLWNYIFYIRQIRNQESQKYTDPMGSDLFRELRNPDEKRMICVF